MNKKIFLILPVLLVVFALGATAANPFNLKFPIPELGNCGSFDLCKVYCDEPSHADACLSFGEKQGLIKKEEVGQAKKFKASLNKGDVPVAGCTDEDSCKELCNLPENRDACFAWAKNHGFIKESDLQKFQNQQGMQGPSGAHGSSNEPGINKEKALQAIKANGGPGGCSSFEECGKFCSNSDNQKVCFEYAKKYNLMSEEDAKRAEKFMSHPGPGGCQGEECKTYCENQNHQKECLKFAVDNGFMTQAQADQQEKFMNLHQNLQNFGGPGGCKGENDCRQYCSDPAHVKECNEFAQKAGLINPDEARKHIQDFENFKKEHNFEDQNSESEDQLNQGSQPQDEQNQEGQDQNVPSRNFQNGPGGCVTPEECIKFCSDPQNRDKCVFKSGNHSQDENQVFPTPPISNCLSRPACLDSVPRCLIPEPASGWCQRIPPTSFPPNPPNIDMQKSCLEHGGTWTGTFCQLPNQPAPNLSPRPSSTPPPLPSISSTPTSTANPSPNPATECAKNGGTWNGSTCIFPTPSPSSSITPTPLPIKSLIQSLIRFLSF